MHPKVGLLSVVKSSNVLKGFSDGSGGLPNGNVATNARGSQEFGCIGFSSQYFSIRFLSCGGYGENVEEQAAVPSHAELESRKRDPLALRALQGPWCYEVLCYPFLLVLGSPVIDVDAYSMLVVTFPILRRGMLWGR